MKQLSFIPKPNFAHGGDLRRGKRKIARVLDAKRPIHLVFRATQARGSQSFLHKSHKGMLHLILLELLEKYHLRLFRYENVGNHLHLIVKGKNRDLLRKFLRVFPQRIMFQVTGAKKGNPQGRFFDSIVYSRLLEWGKELEIVKNYLWKNAMEALGFTKSASGMWLDPLELSG